MYAFFGLLAGALSTLAFLPYIRDTLTGRTQPRRSSWLIWSVLGSIAFASQIYEGASSSLWLSGVQLAGTIIVFLLAIQRGVGGFLNRQDYIVLGLASFGLVLWALAETSVYALMISITINFLGGWVTMTKAYREPHTETLGTWATLGIASLFGVMSIGQLDWVIMAYPLYLLTLNAGIVLAILLGRARVPVSVSGVN